MGAGTPHPQEPGREGTQSAEPGSNSRDVSMQGASHNSESPCPRPMDTQLHQRANLGTNPSPLDFIQHWLYDHSFSHCPAFDKVCFTWEHLRNNIHGAL